MKILRAKKDRQSFYAVMDGSTAKVISGLPYGQIVYTGEEYPIGSLEILAPSEPSKVVAVGLNYVAHAGEMKEKMNETPIIFLKATSSVLPNGGEIIYPQASQRVDYEAELGAVISKKCKNVSPQEAKECVFGYTALNDVTARDLQKVDGQWARAKSFDTFCPFGPYVDTDFDPKGKRVQSILNGQVRQDGNTDDMRFDTFELISFISQCMTLLPGDVIATGTPAGIGPMSKGDSIEIRIEGLESLINKVV
jgi:2-keto-4-pentenoate hydratase/2-oxohepta-3-ene-1,7-dioic acid hydratase in catechol pathway